MHLPLLSYSPIIHTNTHFYLSETPYAVQARALLDLIRKRAPDPDLDSALTEIQDLAISHDIPDPLVPATDALVTCLCLVGAKSLSHMLNVIERYKERLLSLGSRSEKAMKQIIGSVMVFWALRPGVGVAIVDKLTNYGALSPAAVLQWALIDTLNAGESLTHAWIYEMISNTLRKVCSRVRQLVLTRRDAPVDLREMVNEALEKERVEMKRLFGILEDSVYAVAEGSADAMVESEDSERVGLLKEWGKRWLRVFQRKGAVVESWVTEMMTLNAEEEEKAEREADNGHGNGNGAAEGIVAVEEEVL
jgi:nuclear cap-binding protein subunit 1